MLKVALVSKWEQSKKTFTFKTQTLRIQCILGANSTMETLHNSVALFFQMFPSLYPMQPDICGRSGSKFASATIFLVYACLERLWLVKDPAMEVMSAQSINIHSVKQVSTESTQLSSQYYWYLTLSGMERGQNEPPKPNFPQSPPLYH